MDNGTRRTSGICDCADSGCVCGGGCRSREGVVTYFRIDMADEAGTDFCLECGADALDSGLFTDSKRFDVA